MPEELYEVVLETEDGGRIRDTVSATSKRDAKATVKVQARQPIKRVVSVRKK